MRKYRFVANVLTLATGSAMARGLAIVITPILTRLFEPAHFGAAALFVSIVVLITPLASLGFDQAIVLPAREHEAEGLAFLSLLIIVVVCGLSEVLLYLLLQVEAGIEWLRPLGIWVYLVPVAVFLLGLGQAAYGINLRNKKFRPMAAGELVEAITMGGSRVAFGFGFGSSAAGLIGGYLLGSMLRTFTLVYSAKEIISPRVLRNWERPALRRLAGEYREFPLHSTPNNVLRSLHQNLPVFMLSTIFGPAVTGFYALSARLVSMPLILLSDAVRRVFLQRCAQLHNEGRSMKGGLWKATVGLGGAGLIVFAPVFFYGEEIFRFFFGEAWAQAGRYTAILTPWFFAMFVQAPSAAVFPVVRKQKYLLKLQLFSLVLATAMFILIKVLDASPEVALGCFSIISMTVYLTVIFKAFRLVSTSQQEPNTMDASA